MPDKNQQIDQSLTGTMKIDPTKYSAKSNPDRIAGAKYAIAGVLYLIRRQQSIQLASVASVIIVGLAFYFQIELSQFTTLLISIGLVWVTEALNTAIEAVVDIASPEIHPLAKVSKDVAAGATFLATGLAIIITLLTFGPYVLI